jgi:hypothetical protein
MSKQPTELEQLAYMVHNRYGEGKHYEITKAEKTTLGWVLTVCQTTIDEEKDEGAANESNE